MTNRNRKYKRKSKNSNRSNLVLPSRPWSSRRPRAAKQVAPKTWWGSPWDKISWLWSKMPWRYIIARGAEWLWSHRAKVWECIREALSS